jgi:hypothetical protein
VRVVRDFRFMLDKYLQGAGDARIKDWPSWWPMRPSTTTRREPGARIGAALTARPGDGMSDRLARSHVGRDGVDAGDA